jgi:hypothetical protein
VPTPNPVAVKWIRCRVSVALTGGVVLDAWVTSSGPLSSDGGWSG